MKSLHPFSTTGRWYKGNLHCHSTQSDGKKNPLEVVQWYERHGYDFLSITDHNRVTVPETLGESPILTIPGAEINCQRGNVEYHLIGIGIDDMPIAPFKDPQETIDAINGAGGVSIIAHPYWHDLLTEDLLSLNGYSGIEIFNTNCWEEIQKGHSLSHWDSLIRRGPKIWGVASDDAHWKYPDYGGGWIVLKAENLDRSSIIQSLILGNYYSSSGPEIYDMQIEGNSLHIACSPARSIYVNGQYHFSPISKNIWDSYKGDDGCSELIIPNGKFEPMTEVSFELDPRQEILRIEVVDIYGRSAWSNPYFKDKELDQWI